MSIRIGVIGCGTISRDVHLPNLAAIERFQVVAAADNHVAALDQVHAAYPQITTYESYQDLLARADVDAVLIALPAAVQGAVAIAAFEAGKHVYVEKPVAASRAEGETLRTAWKTSGKVGMVGFVYRRNTQYAAARRALSSSVIGPVGQVQAVFTTFVNELPVWKRDDPGMILFDLALHPVDMLRYLFDSEVETVAAKLCRQRWENDTALLSLGMENGTYAQIAVSWSSVPADRMSFYGQQSVLHVDRYQQLAPVSSTAPGFIGGFWGQVKQLAHLPVLREKLRAPYGEPAFRAALEAFAGAVEHHQPLSPDIDDGLSAMQIALAAVESAHTGTIIRIADYLQRLNS